MRRQLPDPIEGDGGLTFKGKTIKVDPSKIMGSQKTSSN